ncbi:hypothetical protein SAMN03080598_03475 [Algoriphagus boritolerans DSM 17298 = JCM 18970]|uniref:Uncharacterized protein n=1 Tax=Algoriphagus boritolerans DSM 17298 = JCM 18970 TaxID=1120964 RepID=A0A1H5ZG31_9BACT|nr:hypothetical protein SAMN03080598_03475 [Algoriphagus boritolerans DSM 17298 = JCM 18970]
MITAPAENIMLNFLFGGAFYRNMGVFSNCTVAAVLKQCLNTVS